MKTEYNLFPFEFLFDKKSEDIIYYDIYSSNLKDTRERIGHVQFTRKDIDVVDRVLLNEGMLTSAFDLGTLVESIGTIKYDIRRENSYIRVLKHYNEWRVGDREQLYTPPQQLTEVFEWAINKLEQQ
jgi:hypothetical protein